MTESGHSNHSDYRPLSGVQWSAPLEHTVALVAPPQRQPELSDARRQRGCRRRHHRVFRSDQTRGRERWQLDSNRSEERMVHDPASLQSARTVLHEGVAAE